MHQDRIEVVRDADGTIRVDENGQEIKRHVDYHVNAYANNSGRRKHLCYHASCYYFSEQYDTRGREHHCFFRPLMDAEVKDMADKEGEYVYFDFETRKLNLEADTSDLMANCAVFQFAMP